MDPSSSSSRNEQKQPLPILPLPESTPLSPEPEQDPQSSSSSSSEAKEEADIDSDADSDADVRELIKGLVKNEGTEIFEWVNDIDSSICPPCVNIICAVSEGSTPVRTPGKASISVLLHHRSMKALEECSTTCKMCLLIMHVLKVGGCELGLLADALSHNERELIRLLARDEKEFGKTIKKPERWNWAQRKWLVVSDSAKAWHEKRRGQPGNMEFTTSKGIVGVELSVQRSEIMLSWARYLILGEKNEDAVGDGSGASSSSSSGSEFDWIPEDEDDPTEETNSEPEKKTDQTSDMTSDVDSDSLSRPTYTAAVTESKDADHMFELLAAARSLQERHWIHKLGYSLREVRGYKGHLTELQVVYGKERYPARVFTTKDDLSSNNNLGRRVYHNANSPETLDLINSWFSNCVENHQECKWSASTPDVDPILPSRVIDVGPSSSSDFTPRLLSPGSKRGKWVALSHRWGQADIFKAFRNNISTLEAGIDVSQLPITFRDAIFLTRHLGLRYLWIDSLCIIQDSPEDWLVEAARMPNIYRNSHITIAAAATENSTGGIFVDRSWLATSKPCKLPVQITSTESHGMVHFDVPFDANLEGTETNYLRSRAWCIQESLLSHRLLTFDTLQMSYTCVREGLIESRQTPPFPAREERNKFLEQFQGGANSLSPGDGTTLRSMIISWYDILYDYIRRDLTFSNDKLVAISGIASVIGTCIQDEYFAGLWQHDMPRALLWSPFEEETLPNAPHTSSLPPEGIYRAPSWSWAAIDSPISCFLCRERLPNPPIATVLEISTTLVGLDTYGQVSAGYLKIQAPVKRAVIGTKSDVWPEQPLLRLDGWQDGDITHGVFDLGLCEEGTSVWCLQITAFYGLILDFVETEGEVGVFKRIGIFHLRTKETSDRVWFGSENVRTVIIV